MKFLDEIPEAGNPASALMFHVLPGGNDLKLSNLLQGYYIHPDLFHDVFYWAKKPYTVKVSAECEIERFTSYSLRPSLTSME